RSARATAWWVDWCVRRSAPGSRSIGCRGRWRPASIPPWPRRCPNWGRGRTRWRAAPPLGGPRGGRWWSSWRRCALHSPRVEGLNPRSCRALAGCVAYVAVSALSETAAFTPRESLARDHLVPLSRGGTNGWNNVLTACSSCNTRKGNLLPEEAGMHPLRPPFEPHFVHLAWAVRRLTSIQSKYIRLFYGGEVLAT